ncbi:hypothetical protein CRE_05973 [Caenorhabditis remanei]|uniref:uridine/cytidine kinase n=1 Tax=Caenorhabditis remanei TaxID=31234 RepID=E3MZB9_CAERE|nr:hypothetical protein CRE_05973 [Caenorhabditis remanei]
MQSSAAVADAAIAATTVTAAKSGPFLIVVCGGSASGKTMFAHLLKTRLNSERVFILSMDHFYRNFTEEEKKEILKEEFNFDSPDALDIDCAHDLIVKMKSGEAVNVPSYSFTKHAREAHTTLVPSMDIIIFEGILSLHDDRIVDMADKKVFVSADEDTRLNRRLTRDARERGRTEESTRAQHEKFVEPAYRAYIAPCANKLGTNGLLVENNEGQNLEPHVESLAKEIREEMKWRGVSL